MYAVVKFRELELRLLPYIIKSRYFAAFSYLRRDGGEIKRRCLVPSAKKARGPS